MLKVNRNCRQSQSAPAALAVAGALFTLVPFLGVPSVHAQAPDASETDKRHSSIFNTTPAPFLRELSADRPDITESPYTVDAGRFQVEQSFVEYSRSADGVDLYSVLPTTLKVGVINNVDLQVVVNPYLRAELEGGVADGFGDLQIRTKWNLWGNDSGTTAFALMPYVRIPTAADDLGTGKVEGGLIVPFAAELAGGWSLGLMAELDVVRNSNEDGYGVEFLHTVALGRDITGPLGAYVEYIGVAPHRTGAGYQASIGVGVTYGITDHLQLDAGTNIGISSGSDDLTLFTGVTFRL